MKKYAIKREFFPWNLFAPPINEKFLALAAANMKTPKFLWRDRALDVAIQNIAADKGETISCFTLSPKGLPEKAPCLIYLHGGGFVLEAAGYHYRNAVRYAKEVGCKVVFPLYRLAPGHPFPAFFEDCYAAFCWAYDNAEELGIDRSHIGIGGDSAGATLAVGVCMMAKERLHPVKFRFQMLPYPFLDARNNSPSAKRFTDTPMWNSSLSDRIGPMTKVDRDNPHYVW
ncbi:MAG: alpha/beta hydrolase [Oscillospiraceae bacterium]|nr:alpha/beta hydrolase [Oscillospiraceae bacterium]